MLPWVRFSRDRYERLLLTLARAVTVGAAYVSTSSIPGLTSSFVAVFVSLLPFDIIVASASPPIRSGDWTRLIAVLRPRVWSTAHTLLKGVAVGAVFGILTWFGLPYAVGAVLTTGLAYVWAVSTRHLITTFVALFAGLALFERLADLQAVETVRVVLEMLSVIVTSAGGTFLGLLAGWCVGIVTGSVTRLFLSRPYRSLQSAAYELPMEMRPFREVLPMGENTFLGTVVVEEGSPVSHRTLAESKLREHWGATVLFLKRRGEERVMPPGSLVLLPGDELVLLVDRDRVPSLHEQFKAPGVSGSPRAGAGSGKAASAHERGEPGEKQGGLRGSDGAREQ